MRYLCLGVLLLFIGCKSDNQNVLDESLIMHSAPMVVPLNTDGGYEINPYTGDSIHPIINSLGDTVRSGIQLPVRARVLDPESIEKPVIIPAGQPEMIPAHLNLDNIPGAFPRISIDSGSLEKVIAGIDPTFFHPERMEGDPESMAMLKLDWGVPVPSGQPEPLKARPPMMKDNARTNIK